MENKLCSILILLLFCVIFFQFDGVLGRKTYKTYPQSGLIFYDVNTNRTILPPFVTSEKYSSLLKFPRIGLPCSCQTLVCGCCFGMMAQQNNNHMCTNFTYSPNDFAIQMDVIMNDHSVYQNSISGRDPPPFCIPVPIPYIPIRMDMCIKLFDVFTPGNNLHMCMDVSARIEKAPIMVLHFECMRMGQDGVAFLKPEEMGGIIGGGGGGGGGVGGGFPPEMNIVSPSSSSTSMPEPDQEDYDTYDEVTEIKMN